jgi:ATP-dependent protease ClpP protease subunit
MRRFETREARFSNRVLMTYAATSLPETLAIKAAVADAPSEILLYDEIGFWGVTASDFAAALSKAGDGPLTLRINSPGGDVFDGYAIYNMLRARTSPVNVVIDGLAASAASFIAMAGAKITMGEPSMLMIHNSWGMCIGDRNSMLDMAATQEKIDGQIAAIYAGKCGKPAAEIATMMDDETWLTSTDAKTQGFCDDVLEPPADRQSAKLENAYREVPLVGARLRNAVAPYDPDGDGDNDALEAIGKISAAISMLTDAVASLNGTDTDDGETSASADAAITATAETEDDDPEALAALAALNAAVEARKRRLRLAEAEAA